MSFDFRGIASGGFGGYELTDQLLYNLKFFLEWGLLNNGAYTSYQFNSSSFYDLDEAKLHSVIDERYPDGQVWEGIGPEWVWETGVTPPSGGTAPFRVSGVYINNIFYGQSSSISGIFGHHIDYPNARIIFDNPQSITDDIRAEFTTKMVKVGLADSLEFRQLLLDAVEEFLTDTVPSGTPVRDHQAWLPAIFIDVDSGRQTGLQLGGGQIKTRIISFHIFADNAYQRNLLMDWLDYQSRTVFWMADLNAIPFPFDQYGDIITGTTNWLDLTNNFPWKKLRVLDGKIQKINSLNTRIFRAKVIWQLEVDFGNI